MVAHDIIPSTSKAEIGGSPSSSLDGSTEGMAICLIKGWRDDFYKGIDIVGINSILKNKNSFGGHLQKSNSNSTLL